MPDVSKRSSGGKTHMADSDDPYLHLFSLVVVRARLPLRSSDG